MVRKHPRLRSAKVITTTFREMRLTYHVYFSRRVYCRVSTGLGRIPKDIPKNAKIGDGPKMSPGSKQRQINLKFLGYGNLGMRITNPYSDFYLLVFLVELSTLPRMASSQKTNPTIFTIHSPLPPTVPTSKNVYAHHNFRLQIQEA